MHTGPPPPTCGRATAPQLRARVSLLVSEYTPGLAIVLTVVLDGLTIALLGSVRRARRVSARAQAIALGRNALPECAHAAPNLDERWLTCFTSTRASESKGR